MSNNNELEKKIINLIEIFKNKSFDEVIDEGIKLFKINKKISILPNIVGASYAAKNDHIHAIQFYEMALEIDNKNTEILNNLGKSQISLEDYEGAIIKFKQSRDIDQNNFDTLFNLGLVYFQLGEYENSLSNYIRAIKINNKVDKLYYNTGIVLSKIGKIKEATKYFLHTIKINNKHIKALNYLGIQFINENKYENAIHYLKEAININPNYAKAYNNLGAAYLQIKDFKAALQCFDKAYSLDNNLIISAIQKYYLKRLFCDWSNEKDLKSIINKTITSNELVSPWFCLSLEDNAENHFLRAKKYSSKYNLLKTNNNIYSNTKIRIGYYAADFHQHAGMINMEGIFKNHNKNEFEIIAFYYGKIKKDATHERIKKYFDKFFYVNEFDDEEIQKLSISNKIDIAIYRAGLTVNARSSIFSHKVAPIQINFLGYPGTTGQQGVDYIISDQFVIPEYHKNYYSEKIIFLTDCYYPRDDSRKISSKRFIREDYNIPKESFVFCSFNNSYKISVEEFNIWIKLLDAVKNSSLLLLSPNKEMKSNLQNFTISKNINLDRLIFLEYISFEDHLSRHYLADLFLDTFNYNAHTSAVDSLWTGLPILTKVGKSFSSRICGSLLNYLELDQLVVKNDEDYFNKAVELATNTKKYKEIKDKIIEAKKLGNFFNTKKYTENLEKAYKKVHQMRVFENKFDNIYIEEN